MFNTLFEIFEGLSNEAWEKWDRKKEKKLKKNERKHGVRCAFLRKDGKPCNKEYPRIQQLKDHINANHWKVK